MDLKEFFEKYFVSEYYINNIEEISNLILHGGIGIGKTYMSSLLLMKKIKDILKENEENNENESDYVPLHMTKTILIISFEEHLPDRNIYSYYIKNICNSLEIEIKDSSNSIKLLFIEYSIYLSSKLYLYEVTIVNGLGVLLSILLFILSICLINSKTLLLDFKVFS